MGKDVMHEVIPTIKKVIHKRIFKLIIIYLIVESFLYISNKGYIIIANPILKIIDFILFTIITFLAVTVLLRLTVSKMYNALEKEVDLEQQIFLTKIYSITIYLIAFALILWKMGVTVNNIAIFLGLAATGIAFAIRDVLMAFFAWYIILQKTPFKINDVIKLGDEFGQVTRIGTFFVTINPTPENKTIIKIPNKNFLEKPIINHGKKIIETIKIQVKKFVKFEIDGLNIKKELIDDKKYLIINFERSFDDVNKKQEIINELIKKKII